MSEVELLSGTYQWLTPAAPAAIAIFCCAPLPVLLDRALPRPGRARFAQLCDPKGQVVDEVVALRLQPELLEIQCHAGPGQRQAIEACLAAHGLKPADAQISDPLWSEAARIAHSAALPYVLGQKPLPAGFQRDYLFREPLVLLTGPANAGKSSLLNHWAGHQRALVHDRPGTTRDLVWVDVECQGWRLRLCDSAGLRGTADHIEAEGQALVAQARERADLVLFLDPVIGEHDIAPGPDDLVIRSKVDLAPEITGWASPEYHPEADRLLDALAEQILARLSLPA
jgi:tRNA U34 5-carboxymethylaminomethyl modifying GTPase MnmE/TrmE